MSVYQHAVHASPLYSRHRAVQDRESSQRSVVVQVEYLDASLVTAYCEKWFVDRFVFCSHSRAHAHAGRVMEQAFIVAH